MSFQAATGILEGETSGPVYDVDEERAGQDRQTPLLNGRDDRTSDRARRLEAASVAPSASAVSDLPETEPARVDTTGRGTRDEEQRTIQTHRAQVSTEQQGQHQQQQPQQTSPLRDFLELPAGTPLPPGRTQPEVPQRQDRSSVMGGGPQDATVTLQQVTTRVVTTSPPEDLPLHHPQEQYQGGQAMWMSRLGEFFQRRVSQAAAVVAPVLERSPRPVMRAIPQAPSSWGAPATPLFSPRGRADYAAVAPTSPTTSWT